MFSSVFGRSIGKTNKQTEKKPFEKQTIVQIQLICQVTNKCVDKSEASSSKRQKLKKDNTKMIKEEYFRFDRKKWENWFCVVD